MQTRATGRSSAERPATWVLRLGVQQWSMGFSYGNIWEKYVETRIFNMNIFYVWREKSMEQGWNIVIKPY